MLRPFRNLAYFLVGLLGASTFLYAVVPQERPLLEAILAHRAECQVLFVGPSYVQSGISEELFDAEAARIGLNLRSCKYAAGALHGYEVLHSLDLLLAQPWPRLEYLVVDLSLGPSQTFDEGNWFKPRFVDWHTWGSVPWLRAHWRWREPKWDNTREIVAHAQHLAMNYLGIGRGIPLLERVHVISLLMGLPVRKGRTAGESHSGANVLDVDDYEGLRLELIEERARLRRQGRRFSNRWALELRERVRSQGFPSPIFIISPILAVRAPVLGSTGPHPELRVFDFADPAGYPELYTPEVRGRTNHLRGNGPAYYSAAVARALLTLRRSP